jgi:methylated-DNA-[protein]-cysteine S-methyltransferase
MMVIDGVGYAQLDTTLGSMLIAYAGGRIVRTTLNGDETKFASELSERYGEPPELDEAAPRAIAGVVRAAIQGAHDLSRVDLSEVGAFQRLVLAETATIPRGEVRTYGEVALAVGAPGAARAVGTALAKNPVPIIVPCHRVVRANGDLGNYSGPGGPGSKERILRLEGAI